ncbi:MAG: CsgG/HfaB family protein, partial [Planctomycetota bacterium]|nr:CsgG/HfaB family protein [Planctomycetota bacterium]
MMKSVLCPAAVLIAAMFLPGTALGAKPRLAIQDITATPAVMNNAVAQGQSNVLQQMLQGADTQLMDTINKTKRFDIVARSKIKAVMREQEIADSGDVNPGDPQTARAFMMAGAKYVATVTVDNYQDIVRKMVVEGGFGASEVERRSIQLQATLQIFDTTTAVMLESASITLEEADTNEVMAGSRESGTATNALIGAMTKTFSAEAANVIMNRLAPAKIIAYTMGNITFNRAQGTGVEVGQYWQVFHPGEEMIDPDTGESLGSEEIPLGWARVTSVHPKFSKAKCVEDFGMDKGNIMRLSPIGLPANVDPNGSCSGSASGGAAPAPPAPPGPPPAPPVS